MGVNKDRRPQATPGYGTFDITASTAPSTAVKTSGVLTLASTSTGATVVYDLAGVPKTGQAALTISAQLVGATSFGFNVNAALGSFFGSSSEDMLSFVESGQSALLMPLSSTRWGVVAGNGVTFSSST